MVSICKVISLTGSLFRWNLENGHSLRLKLNTQNTLTESSFDLTKSSQVMSDLVKKLSQVKALFD